MISFEVMSETLINYIRYFKMRPVLFKVVALLNLLLLGVNKKNNKQQM